MVYDHAVKAYGKFYPAGEEVPEETAETVPEEVPEETEEKPAAKRRTAKKEQLE